MKYLGFILLGLGWIVVIYIIAILIYGYRQLKK